ncbi:MAG: hypothetical protein LBJ61_11390 [Deltaproteobacteria bacterium]|jgi:hypothetical protein|nr:hypothetical protein [Deltaproteobacteria bacterium]
MTKTMRPLANLFGALAMFKNKITLRKVLFFSPTIIIILICAAILLSLLDNTDPGEYNVASKQLLNDGFEFYSTKVYPSNLAKPLNDIVRKRVACYGTFAQNRLKGDCRKEYLLSLLSLGSVSIVESAPNIGSFLNSVGYCPIIYSICRGKGFDTVDCEIIEAKCLDDFFDQFWRGSPYNQSLFEGESKQ